MVRLAANRVSTDTFHFTHGVVPHDTLWRVVACEAQRNGHPNVVTGQESNKREAP